MKMLHAAVSHDMMSPIKNIKYFADRMLQVGLQNRSDEVRKYHQLIDESAKIVSCRMKDLLDQNLIEHNVFVPSESIFSPH